MVDAGTCVAGVEASVFVAGVRAARPGVGTGAWVAGIEACRVGVGA